MKYYTEIVGFELAKELREAGYPQKIGYKWYNIEGELVYVPPFEDEFDEKVAAPTYAEVFDWLLDKNYCVAVTWYDDNLWLGLADCLKDGDPDSTYSTAALDNWHEAANTAIEKVLELEFEKTNNTN